MAKRDERATSGKEPAADEPAMTPEVRNLILSFDAKDRRASKTKRMLEAFGSDGDEETKSLASHKSG